MQLEITLSKAQRFHRISHFLYRHPRGMTTAELVRECGVDQRTIQRDLKDMQDLGIPLYDHGRPARWSITSGYYVPPVRLTLDDAVALYLAARLLARYADNYDPHITAALAKLSCILPEAIATHIQATAQAVAARPEEAMCMERALNTIALGWATGRKVHLRYQPAAQDKPREYTIAPYLIEPSGNATYVIGPVDGSGELRTLKIERALDARLTDVTFEIPSTFDAAALLDTAWGIWYGDRLEEVRLRFAPSAVRRLHETRWHPSQKIEPTADGGCVFTVRVAYPREMVHWILGWGRQVEVLAPEDLRAHLAAEARAMAAVYGEEQG